MTARSPTWVTAAEDWPTPADCTRMTLDQAADLIRHHADAIVHHDMLVTANQRQAQWNRNVIDRIVTMHPEAADLAARAVQPDRSHTCPTNRPCTHQKDMP